MIRKKRTRESQRATLRHFVSVPFETNLSAYSLQIPEILIKVFFRRNAGRFAFSQTAPLSGCAQRNLRINEALLGCPINENKGEYIRK